MAAALSNHPMVGKVHSIPPVTCVGTQVTRILWGGTGALGRLEGERDY